MAMICKKCGAEMNHHSDKVMYGDGNDGAVIEQMVEAHTCPGCGYNDSRMAAN